MNITIKDELPNAKKRASKEIEAQRILFDPRMFQALVDNNPTACIISQYDSIAYFNQACLRLFDYDLDNRLYGISLFDLVAPEHHNILADWFNALSRGAFSSCRFKVSGICFGGTKIPIELKIVVEKFSDESYFILYLKDLRLNEKIDNVYTKLDENLSSNKQEVTEHIILLDLKKNITFINRSIDDLAVDSVLNTSIFNYFPFECHSAMNATFSRVLKSGIPDQCEVSYQTNNSTIISCQAKVSPIVKGNEIIAFLVITQNINAQSFDKKALETSEKELAAILSSLQDTYFRIDCNGHFTKLSPSIHSLLGYHPKELIVQDFEIICAKKADKAALIEDLSQNNGTMTAKTKCFKHKDGSYIWGSTNAHFCYDESGVISGIEGTIRNITEEKVIGDFLQQSEKKFRAIFERSAAGIAVVDLDGHLTVTNPALQKMLGYSENEIAKMIFVDYTHPEDVELNWQLQQEIVNGKRDHYKMEKRCIRKDGEIIWCSVNVSAVHDEKGAVKSILGVLEDITQRKVMEHTLTQSTAKFKAIYNSISDAVIFVDINRKIVTINPAVTEIFGYSFADLESSSAAILYANYYDFEQKKHTHFNINASVERKLYEMEYRRSDGSTFIGETQGTKIVDENGQIIGFISITRDISERKKSEERLRLSQKIFEDTAKAILVTDEKTVITDVNAAFCNATGYSREELLGKKPNLLHSGRHDKIFYEAMWKSLLTTGIWQGEIWDKKKNGEIFPNWATISAVKDEFGNATNYVALLTDITHLKETERRLEQLAHFDQLTGLPNRMIFHRHLKTAVTKAKQTGSSLAVMYIDLDGFKQINDSLGHLAGDNLLVDIGKKLSNCVREGDTVARLGGDEFAIIINNLTDIKVLHYFAERIIKELSISLYYEGKELSVSGSVGIAMYPNDADCENSLLRNADHAMYYAKQNGKSTYQLFASEMNTRLMERIHLEADLRHAVKNREFSIFYQPKYSLRKCIVVGAEALVRWEHPERGLLMPHDFIPFAEDSNLVIELGRQVINQACQHAMLLNYNRANKIPIAINISVRQFKHSDIVKEIQNALENTNLPASLLEIEVTESLIMDDMEQTIETLEELKSMGIKVSIDDFGTGYSSLSYLKKLPVDNLKIDKSFITDISQSDDDRAIVSAILSMAKNLNLNVIAEGVENIEQLAFLEMHHCHEIQGFLFSPPVGFENLINTISTIESKSYC